MARVVTEGGSSHGNDDPEVASAVGKEEEEDGGTPGDGEVIPYGKWRWDVGS